MLSGQRIGVTGATGMLGRYLMASLRARGAEPVGVVRSPDKPPSLGAQGYSMRRADLADMPSLAKAFEGLDAVMANASVIALGGHRPAEVLRTNIDGVRNTFEAMARAGVKRAVMTSTSVAYVPRRGHRYVESDPLRALGGFLHRFNCYAVSKAEAERVAREICARSGIALSIARPHQILGAFDQTGFTRWFRLLMSPRWISVWPVFWRYPSVYAGDLSEAMCRMLERDAAAGEAFNVTGEPGRDSYWDHLLAYRAAGQRVPKVVIPVPFPARHEYSIEKAQRILDFKPRTLVESFRDLVSIEEAQRV
ncbi:MAG: NAD(P)-dependent oxidoreductase [Byssovorax sp.]